MSPEEATEKLLEMVESASLEEVQVLLAADAAPNAKDGDGSNALMVAAANNTNPAVIQTLLAAGAVPNATNRYGETALELAWENGNTAVVEVLEQTSLSPAEATIELLGKVRWASSEEIKTLLDSGADPNAKDRYGLTALMLAALNNKNPAVVKALLAAGANLNDKDKNGVTELDLARASGNAAVIKVFEEAQDQSKRDSGLQES